MRVIRWLSAKQKALLVLLLLSLIYGGMIFVRPALFWEQRAQRVNLLSTDKDLARDFFLDDIRRDINDEYTRKSAYLVFKSYIESGNIYELYDYVGAHPELGFLREAESLYPKSFQKVIKKQVPWHYTDDGMYVYLAYLEILEKHGYGNEMVLSTLTYRYAQMAYYKRMIHEDKIRGESLEYPNYTIDERNRDIEKSILFAKKRDSAIRMIIDTDVVGGNDGIENFLDDITQYASALRYLESLEVDVSQMMDSKTIFSYAVSQAYHFKPELYLKITLTNAATLLLVPSSSPLEIRNAVFPFLDFHVEENGSVPVVGRILRSRVEPDHIRYADLSIYSRVTILSLAEKVLEFKVWLLSNGWSESDF